MLKHMDTIQFEERAEIGAIIQALEASPMKDDKTVQRLITLLDIMDMEW